MDIEWATLCKVVEVSDVPALLKARIRESFFQDPRNAETYRWLVDHWNNHGNSPGEAAFYHEYPEDALIDTPEPLSYYLGELRSNHRYARVTEMLDNVRDPIKEGDAITAIKILNSSLEAIHAEVADLADEDFTKTTKERLALYEELATLGGQLRGIPTGFPTMDLATSGLQNEQLVSIIGETKAGKSAILLVMAITAHQHGHRPLFVTFEMSNDEQAMRHDALRAGISYNRLTNGKLLPIEKKRLGRMMHGLESMPPMMFVHDPASVTTVSALAAKITEHKPDVVFVDGAYMLDAEVPNLEPMSAQALTTITRSLKRLAQRAQVPIAITTQALTWKMPGKKLSLNSIGYSSSFAQDSDVIFGVEEIKDTPGERTLKIIAARNTSKRDVRLRYDWDRGQILEIEEIHYESDDVDEGDEN